VNWRTSHRNSYVTHVRVEDRQKSLPELCSVHLRTTYLSMYGNFRIKLYASVRKLRPSIYGSFRTASYGSFRDRLTTVMSSVNARNKVRNKVPAAILAGALWQTPVTPPSKKACQSHMPVDELSRSPKVIEDSTEHNTSSRINNVQ